MLLDEFRHSLQSDDPLADIRRGLIGEGIMIPGESGPVPLVYADYVASGRALRQVEEFVSERILPFYANSHTEESHCGGFMTGLREQARATIARLTNAGTDCSVIFAGSGATAGLNRLVSLLGVHKAERAVVFLGPYEHHSNILPWRESGATIVNIPEAENGGPDLDALETALIAFREYDLRIGAFSAASNVSGILTDVDAVTRLLKFHGALAVWDYAAGAPYLEIDMQGAGAGAEKDAVVFSAHKFPGGPGASGVMILRNSAVRATAPTWPGGGSVAYVSPWAHDYVGNLAEREEAGTPNILGDIRAALVMLAKDAIGQQAIEAREARFNEMALARWGRNPQMRLLGVETGAPRLPIFSFLVRGADGAMADHKEFTRLLSARYGIQARGGCSCAGPYGHHLLGVDRPTSEALRARVAKGDDAAKPGWVRLNFSYLMTDDTARFIIDAVDDLARSTGLVPAVYSDAVALSPSAG
ncbi:MAG: aminotransferase class V-fold PLP-dependent enzyme [Paracoccaceae bacterium]|nr:aminotransferase class V-fold PLP-dependent enzyme [Paracoccaceae bacterium]